MNQISIESSVGGLGMSRSKSVFASLSEGFSTFSEGSFASCVTTSESDQSVVTDDEDNLALATAILKYTDGALQSPDFHDSGLRKLMEPFLKSTRDTRQKSFHRQHFAVHASIASSMGVPYTALRGERVFLFDTHTHPLHEIIASTLGVTDLASLHKVYGGEPCSDLQFKLSQAGIRERIHSAYENFVNSFCIPLLHEMAISKRMLHVNSNSSGCIVYRYQAFPTIHVHVPGSHTQLLSPTCDLASGHSIGCLKFHVPLTPSFGTNALYVESHPGREDWHPLIAKSAGLGYIFDGSRCIHFDVANTTDATRVSLEFRVLLYRSTAPPHSIPLDDGILTAPDLIEDRRSKEDSGYYEESIIDLSRLFQSMELVAKRTNSVTNMSSTGISTMRV
jgi:hypothetical protein